MLFFIIRTLKIIRRVFPIMMVYAVISWGSGLILARLGFSIGKILLFSVFVYSGVIQYMLADLAQDVNGVVSTNMDALMPTTTAIVLLSLRHLFYSTHFSQLVLGMPFWKKILLSVQLTDETYAFKNVFLAKPLIFSEALTVNMACHASWITFSIIGAMFSVEMEDSFLGKLECFNFAMPTMFLTLFYFSLQKAPWKKVAFLVGLSSFVLMLFFSLFYPFLLALLLVVIVTTILGAFFVLRSESMSKKMATNQ